EDVDDPDGLVADQSCADHRIFHALEVRGFTHEVADNVFGHRLPYLDDHLLFPGRQAYYRAGSEMKLRAAILSLLLSMWAAPAFSQGCAMCFSTAAAASKDGQRAISKGVLVLLVPPAGFMSLGVGLALYYGK